MNIEHYIRVGRLLAELHGDEVLSEQQCAKIMGVDLVSWRIIEHTFCRGSWGETVDESGPTSEEAIRAALHPAAPEKPVNGIPATLCHDEGAVSRCSYCGRYSLDPKTLGDRQPKCDCGEKFGWSGSFKKPGPDAEWSGAAPSTLATEKVTADALTDERIIDIAYESDLAPLAPEATCLDFARRILSE